MGVTHLSKGEGEDFLFDGPPTDTFWMKNTLLPLSIAFWDASGTIVDILDMQPCNADSCPTYAASAAYTTALEMNQGWFERNGIQIGDHAEFSYQSL